MKVLLGCECSGVGRRAFRALGHDAWSCDIKEAEDASPYHMQRDVLEILNDGWDMAIFHPVCKYLTNAGIRWLFEEEGRWQKMLDGAAFYAALWNAPIERVAIENPVMHPYALKEIRRLAPTHPTKRQTVQPWMFGHMETKATGWATRNLPALVETNNVRAETYALPYKERARVHYMAPGPDRETERSRSYPGMLRAIAEQWGGSA